MKRYKFVVTIALLTMVLVACGQPTIENNAGPTRSPLPTAPVSPISPLPTPQIEADAAVDKLSELRVQVTEQLGLSDKALTLVSSEQVNWPDTSLGCPQPDMTYAQVVTPGWRIVFMGDEGQEYNVHTTEKLERFVICESSTQTEVPSADQDNPAVKAAMKTLVEQEGVALESVTVVSIAAVEWPNSCLGCEKQGQICLTVITPGYRITLKSGTETYTFHTDRTGRQVILCTQPSLTPPRSDS